MKKLCIQIEPRTTETDRILNNNNFYYTSIKGWFEYMTEGSDITNAFKSLKELKKSTIIKKFRMFYVSEYNMFDKFLDE